MLLRRGYGPVIQFKMARSLLGKPLYFTTAYLYETLLIDTGCPRTAKELLKAVRDIPIEAIVCTHSHEDHFGAAAALKRERRIPVKAHPKALPIMADPQLLSLKWFQRQFWGKPNPVEAEPLSDKLELGEKRFEVIETPGHSPDHVVLFENDSGFLFSGDIVVGGLDRAIRADFDIWGILKSLRKLLDLKPKIIFSGSGKIIEEPQTSLQAHINRIEAQAERVQLEFDEGQPISGIVKRIHREAKKNGHSLGWVERITRGHISTKNLVKSFLGISSS
ncbi:MAG: MBL fold metallo-hydrolase [Candidatus Hodarchaeota archaeon]